MHYNQYITSGQTSYKLREHFSMMILSIVATVVLLGALFYHWVSLLLSSVILLAWTAALGAAGVWNIWLLLPLAIILLPFNFAPMRKSMISAPAFLHIPQGDAADVAHGKKKPSTPAPPGGKAICFAAILTRQKLH